MAWQCLNWASAQDIPNRAKPLLIILANHANGETGHCFPSIELLMKETSYSRSAVYGFLGMLKRNGYITVRKAKGSGRAADIWLNMDRPETPWIPSKTKRPEPPDPLDIDPSPETGLDNLPQNDDPESNPWTEGVQSLDENGGESLYAEPSYIEPSRETPSEMPTPPPPEPPALVVDRGKPKSFDPSHRQRELERIKAADEARKSPVFLKVGTPAYDAWCTYKTKQRGSSWQLSTRAIVKGESCSGWWFPTCYPPRESTGPPVDGAEFSDEFEDHETAEAE